MKPISGLVGNLEKSVDNKKVHFWALPVNRFFSLSATLKANPSKR